MYVPANASKRANTAVEEVKYSSVKHKSKLDKDEEGITYTSVDHTRTALHKESDAKGNVEVIYSPVVQNTTSG